MFPVIQAILGYFGYFKIKKLFPVEALQATTAIPDSLSNIKSVVNSIQIVHMKLLDRFTFVTPEDGKEIRDRIDNAYLYIYSEINSMTEYTKSLENLFRTINKMIGNQRGGGQNGTTGMDGVLS